MVQQLYEKASRTASFVQHYAAMCHRIVCSRCGKAGWAGCGRHVEQALAGIPPQQRCTCPPPKSLIERIFGSRK
jgi:hypothetical protein